MNQSNSAANIRTVSAFACGFFAFIGSLGLFFYNLNPNILFASVGFVAAAIVMLPAALQKEYDVFSTWTFAGLSIILGSTIRGIYISLNYPDFDTLDDLFLRGNTPDYFIWPAILLLGCLLMMAIGYIFVPVRRNPFFGRMVEIELSGRKVYGFAFIALAISLICTYFYIRFTGGFSLASLSSKRTLIGSIDLSAEHRTWQSLRVIATVSMLAHLLVLTDAIRSEGRSKTGKYCLAVALFLVATFLPFYASSRGPVMMNCVFTLATYFYVKRTLPWTKIIVLALSGLLVFHCMSVLRRTKDFTLSEVIANTIESPKIIDHMVLNRNDLELGKTAHIMRAIPDDLQLQYGKTIGVWFVAPIPREIWNAKPMISSGPIIGTVIYKNRISGVPPGFVGEMYWNFSVVGVLIGGFLFGWLMSWVQINFSPWLSNSTSGMAIYIFGPMQVGYLTIGTALGYGLVNVGVTTIIAVIIMWQLRVTDR